MEELRNQVKALFDAYHFPGHDFKHVDRVSKLAKQIAEAEGYDAQEAEIAGLLHDVGRTVKDPQKPHAIEGVPIARRLLDKYTDLPDDAKERILKAIEVHSDKTTEGELNNILQDADKLDGIGAIGINRAYTTHHTKPDFFEDKVIPEMTDYFKSKTSHEGILWQINWYSMLYTEKAKEIGKHRYEYMKQFMEQIKKEVEESK
jgi:uncharacterized protein